MPRGKVAGSLLLPRIAPEAGEAKHAWVYRAIRSYIEHGQLKAGGRLPSSRDLAKSWEVSRGVVDIAFQKLASEGYVESRSGSGTVVKAVLPAQFFELRDTAQTHGKRKSQPAENPPARASKLVPNLPFVSRQTDVSLFPFETWARLSAATLRELTPAALYDDDVRGYRPLREQIAEYLGAFRGISCDPDHIHIVTGIRHALELSLRVLLQPGQVVAVEDPCYAGARPLIAASHAKAVPIPVDENGMQAATLRSLRSKPQLTYLTPSHQAPLGYTLSISRRAELLQWAGATQSWLFEDDYDSEFRYRTAPLAAMKSLDHQDRVIFAGSFNKTLFPSLRIGYMVVPPLLAERFAHVHRTGGRGNALTDQVTLAKFMQKGFFTRHLRRSREVYARRQGILMAELEPLLASGVRFSGHECGFHFVLWLPQSVTEARFIEEAKAVGIQLQGISDFCLRRDIAPGVILGFTAIDDHLLKTAAVKLKKLLLRLL
jgi:GntR family transcriptional regulator/MocR family aminotransferase